MANGGRHPVPPTLIPTPQRGAEGAGMEVERRARESAAARYRPRRPNQSVLYRCVQEHLETWLAQCRDGHDDEWSVPEHVERDFRRYVDCGIPTGLSFRPRRMPSSRRLGGHERWSEWPNYVNEGSEAPASLN